MSPQEEAQTEQKIRRAYMAPRVLSAEPLEAAAANCDGTSGFGKPGIVACEPATLGS